MTSLSIVLALLLVGLLACVHIFFIPMHPKAGLLCKAWAWAEGKEPSKTNTR